MHTGIQYADYQADFTCLDIPTVFRKLNHVSCDDDSWLDHYDHVTLDSSVDDLEILDTELLCVPTFLRRSNSSTKRLEEEPKSKSSNDYVRLFEVFDFRLREDERTVLQFDSIFELEQVGLTPGFCKRLAKLMLRFEISQKALVAILFDHVLCQKEFCIESKLLKELFQDACASIDDAKQANLDVALAELLGNDKGC